MTFNEINESSGINVFKKRFKRVADSVALICSESLFHSLGHRLMNDLTPPVLNHGLCLRAVTTGSSPEPKCKTQKQTNASMFSLTKKQKITSTSKFYPTGGKQAVRKPEFKNTRAM